MFCWVKLCSQQLAEALACVTLKTIVRDDEVTDGLGKFIERTLLLLVGLENELQHFWFDA